VRGLATRLWLAVALVATAAFVLTPAAPAATGTAVEVDTTIGQIYDVDAGRILSRRSDSAFEIKDRATHAETTITLPADRHPLGGFLTTHGAMLTTVGPTSATNELFEYRDGVLTSLGSDHLGTALSVAGGYAAWHNGETVLRRDLAGTATPTTVASGTMTQCCSDVAANGDVVYSQGGTTEFDGPYTSVVRWKDGTPTTLEAGGTGSTAFGGVTDGTNVVWTSKGKVSNSSSIKAYGASAAISLPQTSRHGSATPGPDYRVANGFIAYTAGAADAGGGPIKLREPDGDFVDVVTENLNLIVGLGPSGQVLYRDLATAGKLFLWRPGADTVEVPVTYPTVDNNWTRGYGDFAIELGGRWYLAIGNSLKRIALSDAPGDGSTTEIDGQPPADDAPAHSVVTFHATPAPDDFECNLDDTVWVAGCESPKDLGDLPHGPHSLGIRAVKGAVVEADPARAEWTVESDPPDVTLDSPPARTADTTPTFGGDAGTAGEDDTGVRLTIQPGTEAGAPVVRTVNVTRSGASWSATVTPALADGVYTAEAEQDDAASNVGHSARRTFTVDTTAPSAMLSIGPNPVYPGHSVSFDASGSGDAGGGAIGRYEWDLDGDGDFERDTGTHATTSRAYSTTRDVHVSVRVTDSVGNSAIAVSDLTVAPEPPPGFLGVTVNHGDRFTNDPHVVVNPVWPPGDTEILLSNDGGFQDVTPLPLAASVPWTLDSSGLERLPKTIYARFSPNGTTYQDDIILDETPPAVLLATFDDGAAVNGAAVHKHTYHLRIKGRDRTSGINRMQITTKRRHPGRKRHYKNHVKFRASTSRIYVRLRDRAGNWSHWKRVGS
jgi:Bacterial Ig-like domain